MAEAIAFASAHETPWPRDPKTDPQRFGVHIEDPPPWNRLLGPLHARGPQGGVVWQHGTEIAAWGEPARADQTFSVAKTYLALLAGVAQQQGLLPDVDRPVVAQLPHLVQAAAGGAPTDRPGQSHVGLSRDAARQRRAGPAAGCCSWR